MGTFCFGQARPRSRFGGVGIGAAWTLSAVFLGLGGCSGDGAHGPRGVDSETQLEEPSTSGDAEPFEPQPDCVAHRVEEAQQELGLCRACHVAGGVAEGTRWSLSDDRSQDAANLTRAFSVLKHELLAIPAQTGEARHGGGLLLRPDSRAFQRFSALVSALDSPGRACVSSGVVAPHAEQAPLLGDKHGGHIWSTFCAQQPDEALLPVDPRTLVKAGVGGSGITHFNAHWVECDGVAPTTCGEYRAGFARGKQIMEGGEMWFFGGNHLDAMLTISAQDYNNLWREWGYSTRPSDFDAKVAERWGVPLAETRNPYPLPGEDPNKTSGGSGQLPVALTQLRDENGRYQGSVSFNCHWCHSGKVGDPSEGPGLGTLYGSGNSLLDVSAGFANFVGGLTRFIPVAANKTRGSGDILLYPAIAALDVDRALHYNESLVAAPAQGSVDYPVWWNAGHRTRRFQDGSFAMDNARPVMGFFMPIFTYSSVLDIWRGREWIDERSGDVQLWLESLTAPKYPGKIEVSLAEAGAILFHNKDLWAPELHNGAKRPQGGNGSCASCHGVYAPRYARDPAYLATPELEGMAAYVVPIDVIDTDRARFSSLTERLSETLKHSWWGYGTNETESECFGMIEQGGYLAPPLYGVWASAPYFHNGSIPNVWEVLKPSDRKDIWRRVSSPAPEGDPKAFMGFDTNLARAYDHERLGFRYDELPCSDALFEQTLQCGNAEEEGNAAADALASGSFGDVWFTWNIAAQPQDAAMLEQRKIYNTHHYSQGNGGHAFTAVLTDAERRALIEYLKTL